MARFDWDLFVIGAGSGGVRAARVASELGARVAIAEERYLGGTCVNVGCIPKKLLVYAASVGEKLEGASAYGWTVERASFDWSAFLANKDREIARLNGVYEALLRQRGVEILRARARITGPHALEVDGRTVTAERILVATGSWPVVPDVPGREHAVTSNEVFHLAELPRRVLVVGGGYIAVELAGVLHALGAQTTLAHRGETFLRGFDEDLRRVLAREMARQGVTLRFGTVGERMERTSEGVALVLPTGERLTADVLVCATGRVPSTRGLGLESVGVALGANGGIVVDDDYRSSVPSVYAVGDVIARLALTPVAIAEATIFARRAFGGSEAAAAALGYELVPTAVFSHPPIGTVGLTEARARERGHDVTVFVSEYTPLEHTLTQSGEKTFMKLIVDRASDRVLGAHMVGADAPEIIQGVAIALQAGATKAVFDRTIGIHPTSAEEFVTMRTPRG